MPATLEIEFANQRMTLLADRALFWPARKSLVLADVHLGKDASFRAAGLPIPAGNSTKDLARIEALIAQTAATKLVILGDLIHSRASHQPELASAFARWRADHSELEIQLVRGNHDRRAGPIPARWDITEVAEPFDAEGIVLAHVPQRSDKPLLCGHVHPAIAVRDYDGSFARIPCFVADTRQLMFPSFGSFTGGYVIRGEPGRSIYPVTGKTVTVLRC